MLKYNKKLSYWEIGNPYYEDYTAHPTVPRVIIPKIKIPTALRLALKKLHLVEEIPTECKKYIKCIESLSNVKSIKRDEYLFVFKICLYLEQYQSDLELKMLKMKDYNIVQVTSDRCFIMNVPSLDSEKPIVVADDLVTLYDVITKTKFRGIVTRVAGNDITVRLQDYIATQIKNREFNIKFHGNYWPLRCCHYALSLAMEFNFFKIIYPQQTINNMDLKCDINWINTNITENKQQKQAVIKILHMTANPAPYIIFGPPGTGKTATLVEAICQIVKQDAKNNILICTSSNAAADEITQRLIKYLPAEIIYRMYAPSRHWEDVKTDIKKCANFVTGTLNTTIFLPKEILMMRKIIISTLITSVRLAAVRFRENHFSHIIIDEASQITEPEMLIPITLTKKDVNNVTNFQPQIVIAGDHHQLGPVVRNKFAINILGKSMLERLMTDCDLYKKKDGKYNPNYITKLVQNYRSHKDILHIPNTHFYDGDLVCYEQPDTQIALNWKKLPGKKFPIIFQEVLGVEEKTETKSVYNTVEALVVVRYVEMLMNAKFGNHRISAKDIGIVTPFKKQQLNIMHKLAARCWEDISVGTVEMFQGQERTVIIISTVRSKIFTHDGVQHIGFLSNEKRFNVAVTRAKALLIVVGNPKIICTNKHWEALYEYCKKHGGYVPFKKCPLDPNILKKYKLESNDGNEENADVNEVSVTVETNVGDEKKLETLTNVLVRGIEKKLTLTK